MENLPPLPAASPRVTVLLATHNGRAWLPEQLDSILGQQGADVRIIALDDGSTDGTRDWLLEQTATEPRLCVLPMRTASRGAADNFYRLLQQADFGPGELIAFADQDDVWLPGKLARHADLLQRLGCDGVSSNVTAFTPEGTRTLVDKAYPQRRFDYIFESPGPGSTFLMSFRLAALARDLLAAGGPAASVEYHDWLIYVVARAKDWRWLIDPEPTVDYRQHEHNVMGANVGIRSALSRLRLISRHWHREQACMLAGIAVEVAGGNTHAELSALQPLLSSGAIAARFRLAGRCTQLRRRRRDQMILGALITIGLW